MGTKVTKVKTNCDGEVSLNVNKETGTLVAKFIGVKQDTLCTVCRFKEFCFIVSGDIAAETNTPLETPKKVVTKPEPVTLPEGTKTILVKAFTGMAIGELPIIVEEEDAIEVLTKGGQSIRFDKVTGLQINCKNPRYANRIEGAQ